MKNNSFNYSKERYANDKSYYVGKLGRIRINKILLLSGKNKKILDVGCYIGEVGEELLKLGNEVFGIDASVQAVDLAKRRGVKAFVSNLEKKFPFRSETFDLVFAGEVIEHILDTDFFIDEIKRVLKSKGELIVTTPNTASLARRLMLLMGVAPFFEASFTFPATSGHIRFYTKGLLEKYLVYKGFKIISFESDVLNFTNQICSEKLARFFPTLGRGLIFKCQKN